MTTTQEHAAVARGEDARRRSAARGAPEPRPSGYTAAIRQIAAAQGRAGVNPWYLEAWMRVEHGTLDSLSPAQFRREVALALRSVDECGEDASRRLAQSYGLLPLSDRRA